MSSTKHNSNNRISPFLADDIEKNVIYYRFMGASDVFESLPILGTTVRLLDVKQGIVQSDHPLLLKGIKSYCDGDSTRNESDNNKEEEIDLLLFDAITSKLYSNDNLSLPAGIQLLVFQFPSSTTALIMQNNDDDIDEEDNSDDSVKNDSSSQENDDSDSVTRCSCSVCINNTYHHNGDGYMDASPSTSEIDDQTLDGISSTNEEENDDLSGYTRSSSNFIYRIMDREDDEDNETLADADYSGDHDDEWSPNGNTSSGVVRLSLLALSAAIHATKTLIEDDGSEGLSELMSCPVMKHHLDWTVNARCAVLKIQDFYWHHVHQWSDIEDDDDDEDDDDSYDFYDDDDDFSDAAYFYSYYYYHHFFDDDDYYSDEYHDFYDGEGEEDTDEDGYFS
jgi:hypothetical protein